MFDVEECTKPKKTPIQKDPLGFPGLHNEEINIFDVTLNYPASLDQVLQLARQCNIDPKKIVVVDKNYNDGFNTEMDNQEEETLLTSDYPEDTKEQKECNDSFADSFQEAAKSFAGDMNTEFEIAGGNAPSAKFNTDHEEGKMGPLSKVNRPKVKDMPK